MISYLLCRMHDHAYASVTCQGADRDGDYLYCLRCGKVEGGGEVQRTISAVASSNTTRATASQRRYN